MDKGAAKGHTNTKGVIRCTQAPLTPSTHRSVHRATRNAFIFGKPRRLAHFFLFRTSVQQFVCETESSERDGILTASEYESGTGQRHAALS